MAETTYRGRRAVSLQNEHLEVIVTVEGGHIAAIQDRATGVNPLWSPPWPTIEPSSYDPAQHPEYGLNAESRLLAGILGHNLCLDLFGGPSEAEAAAGMSVHGEASVAAYDIATSEDVLVQSAFLPHSQLAFHRSIRLPAGSRRLTISETVENLSAWDRPIAWTQHVTLGAPFVAPGKTVFRTSATKSKVIDTDFSGAGGYMKPGAEFMWPHVPTLDGSLVDMQPFVDREVSAAFSTHLMDPSRETAFFSAWDPASRMQFAYVWRQHDFPWLGIWEENRCRTAPPWNGQTITRGMEFGVSPFPETRRAMIDRGGLFGVPGYRWIPALSKVQVEYIAVLHPAGSADDLVL